VFLDVEIQLHEILIDDGLDVVGPDKTIEFVAPASPRGVENGEDRALAGGLLFGGCQKIFSGAWSIGRGQSGRQQ
jgi:hypothetical protein